LSVVIPTLILASIHPEKGICRPICNFTYDKALFGISFGISAQITLGSFCYFYRFAVLCCELGRDGVGSRIVAGTLMSRGYLTQGRLFAAAEGEFFWVTLCQRAAGVEVAAAGRVDGRRGVAREQDTLTFILKVRVRQWYSAQQALCVRMVRLFIEATPVAVLNYFAQIHNSDLIRDVLND